MLLHNMKHNFITKLNMYNEINEYIILGTFAKLSFVK